MSRFKRLLFATAGGLRIFHDSLYPGRVAVADDSGATPDKTDDGIWWLDFSRPIVCESPPGPDHEPYMGHWSLPLISPDGRKSSTPFMGRSIDPLSKTFNMRVDLESESNNEDGSPHVILGED